MRIGRVTGQPAPEIDWTLDVTNSVVYTSGNKVGIGTGTISDGSGGGGQDLELDVAGDIGADYYCDANGLNCFTASDVTGAIDWDNIVDAMTLDATTTIDMDTNTANLNFDNNTFVIDSVNNRIGIGTSTPSTALELSGVDSSVIRLTETSAGAAFSGELVFDRTSENAGRRLGEIRFSDSAGWSSIIAISDPTNASGSELQFDTGPIGPGFNARAMTIKSDQSIGIGTDTPNASSLVDITSTTRGFLAPRMNNTERDAIATPATGLMIYSTTDGLYQFYDGATWTNIGGGGAVTVAIDDLTDGYKELTYNNMFLGHEGGGNLGANTEFNVGIGIGALDAIDNAIAGASTGTGSHNIALGYNASTNITGAERTIAIGTNALGTLTQGVDFIAIGRNSLSSFNDAGTGDGANFGRGIAIGNNALENIDNTNNIYFTAIGHNAAQAVTAGFQSVVIGSDAANNLTGLSYSTIIGEGAGQSTTPTANGFSVIMGSNACLNSTGEGHVVIGSQAGNTACGANNNILIGRNINASSAISSNELNIGDTIFGNLSNNQIGIGVADATAINTDAILELDSTSRGLLLPRMTTVQRDAISGGTPTDAGLTIYNTTTNTTDYWDGTAWVSFASTSGGATTLIDADSDTQIQVEESADEDIIRFDTAGAERMVIDSTGRLGLGTGTPSTIFNIVGQDYSNNFRQDAFGNNAYHAVYNQMRRARGTIASPLTVQNGDEIGEYAFWGYDGDSYEVSSIIVSNVSGPVNDGVVPGELGFFVSDTAGTLAEAMRIDNSYGVAIGTGAATDASAILDVASTTRGFLAPRMNNTARDAIASPATGLMIYSTTDDLYQFYNGATWTNIGGGGAVTVALNDITDVLNDFTTDFDGEADNDDDNLFIGHLAPTLTGDANPGARNTAIGVTAMDAITTGDNNIAIGYDAGTEITTASGSVLVGANAGAANQTMGDMVAIGNNAGASVTTSAFGGPVFIGSYAGDALTDGYGVMAIGYNTLTDATANNVTGTVAIGNTAMFGSGASGTAQSNTALGGFAGGYFSTGNDNVFIGAGSGAGAAGWDGASNVFVGQGIGPALTGGNTDNNIFVGQNVAATLTSGDNNILIGQGVDVSSADASNELNIGDTIFGDLANGYVGIGTNNPTIPLSIVRNDNPSTIVQISTYQPSQDLLRLRRSANWIEFNTGTSGNFRLNSDSGTLMIFDTDGNNISFGTTPPDASASLDIQSTTRGFLAPRMTDVQRDAIGAPATGLIVYNTTGDTIDYYDGSAWVSFATTAGTVTPAGTDGQVQYNDGGTSLGADAGMTYSAASDTLTIGTAIEVGDYINIAGQAGSAPDFAALNDLSNVNTTPADGDALIYNSVSGDWEAGGVSASNIDWDDIVDAMTLDATTTIDMDTNTANLNFDSDTFFIDSTNNNIGIGTNTPNSSAILSMVGDNKDLYLESNNNTNASFGADIDMRRSRAGGIIQDGDKIGAVRFRSEDGTGNFRLSAQITATANGTPGSADVPADLSFHVAPDGTVADVTGTPQLIIKSAGNIGMGIGTPDASALLDMTSTTQGFLAPRMTGAQRDAIGTPATGLVIYNTDGNTMDYYNGTIWTSFASSAGSASTVIDADSDTQIQVEESADEDIIRFDTAGTERMVIAAGGNVGIGNATPSSTLDVTGDIEVSNYVKFNGTAGDAPTYVSVGGSSLTDDSIDWDKIVDTMELDATTTIDMDTNTANLNFDSDTFFIDSANNRIGIGTNTPSNKLEVLQGNIVVKEDDDGNIGVELSADNSSGSIEIKNNGTNTIHLSANPSNTTFLNAGSVVFGNTTADASAKVQIDSTTQGFLAPRMTAAQRDAITTPATGLVVYNTDGNTMDYYNGTIWTSFASSAGSASTVIDADSDTQIQVEESADDDTIRFDTAGTERMVISATGDVGIGTASPSNDLEVVGDARADSIILNGTAGDAPTYITQSGLDWDSFADAMTLDATTTIDMDTNSANLNFDSDTFVIDSANNRIGMGIAAPADKFAISMNDDALSIRDSADADNERVRLAVSDFSNGEIYVYDGNETQMFYASNAGTISSSYTGMLIRDYDSTAIPSDVGSAALHFDVTGKGILFPRMDTTARDAIATPATGLVIYNTTTNTTDYYNGSAWVSYATSAGGGGSIDGLSDASTDYVTDFNMFMGDSAGASISSGGQYNLAIGQNALTAVTTGDENLALGYNSLNTITDHSGIIAIGANAGRQFNGTAAGVPSLFIGNGAGETAGNTFNTGILAIGSNVLRYSGSSNNVGGTTAVGNAALENSGQNGNAEDNTALGVLAGIYQRAGNDNVYIGANAAQGGNTYNHSGDNNIFIGSQAGQNLDGVNNNNVIIGQGTASTLDAGDNNILIGQGVDVSGATASNELNIGDTIYGDLSNDYIGIGNSTPDVALDVTGDIEYTGTITDVSDRRLKTDINPLNTQDVINRIAQIDTYSFKMKDDEKGRIEFGVMAQELEEIFPELVHNGK